jgi:hypothetical protein
MIRYVGQLYALYWSSWGVFFPLAVVLVGSVGAALALFALQQADARLGLGLTHRLAKWLPARRKLKSEV